MKIVSYRGENVDIRGKMMGVLEFERKIHQTKIIVTGRGKILLGIRDCNELGIVVWPKLGMRNMNKVNINKVNYSFYLGSEQICFQIELLGGQRPVIGRERQVPFVIRSGVEELRRMICIGVLEKATQTDWVCPIVIARKKDGSFRICGDCNAANKCIQLDKCPLPGGGDLLAISGAANRYFAKIDLEAAYHQIPLAVNNRLHTTVITHIGICKFTRIPFGIKSGPSAFQRIITNW